MGWCRGDDGWRGVAAEKGGRCGGCDDDIDGGMMMMMMMDGVMVAAVGRQPEEVEARGGEWIWGSGRSGHEDSIWFRPERSPKNFSGGGGMVAGGGGWPEKMTGGGGVPEYLREKEGVYKCGRRKVTGE
ncbi:hypothetical protein Tco_1250725 [Tanacetum coccineum]